MRAKYSFEIKADKNGLEHSKYIIRVKHGGKCIFAPRVATLKDAFNELADCIDEYVPTEQDKIKVEIITY